MNEAPPIVLIPGLLASARLYAPQLAPLWCVGPVTIANHTHADTLSALARRILDGAPPRFALAGLSMGGYIAFEIMRQAAARVAKLALLDTGARAETAAQTELRKAPMEMAKSGRFAEVAAAAFEFYVHPDRHSDLALKTQFMTMAEENGAQAYLRQQRAIMGRPESRPSLSAIACPTLVLVGEQDRGTPVELSQEIAAAIPGSRLVIIPACGHLSTIERPAAVSEALVEWMQA